MNPFAPTHELPRSPAKQLSAALNEELASETAAIELAARMSAERTGTRPGTFLLMMSWALEEDRDALATSMRALGVHRKHAHLRRVRPPADLAAGLDALELAVRRKAATWEELHDLAGDRATAVIDRAEGQADALGRRRMELAVPPTVA